MVSSIQNIRDWANGSRSERISYYGQIECHNEGGINRASITPNSERELAVRDEVIRRVDAELLPHVGDDGEIRAGAVFPDYEIGGNEVVWDHGLQSLRVNHIEKNAAAWWKVISAAFP